MSLAHNWESYESDDGIMGVNDYWRCRRCGASGGVHWPGHDAGPAWAAIPGDGRGILLVSYEDCELAARQIADDKAFLARMGLHTIEALLALDVLCESEKSVAQTWLDAGKDLEPWQKGWILAAAARYGMEQRIVPS